jgi:catechol 2,3-dioxygenase-like lactoylglutathione lyase family enzyme
MAPPINRIVVYTKKLPEMVAFYTRFFGFKAHQRDGDRIVELQPRSGGLSIMLHPAGKGKKEGQTSIKLVFDIENVEAFRAQLGAAGLDFGPIHYADGYAFANAKDPSNNSISSRAYSLAR